MYNDVMGSKGRGEMIDRNLQTIRVTPVERGGVLLNPNVVRRDRHYRSYASRKFKGLI